MSEPNYSSILCSNIAVLRKKHGLTQETLAEKLGITFQAVSKWENGQSCPDIDLLPQLADIFSVNIDELFGRTKNDSSHSGSAEAFPWQDDGKIRAAVYIGRRLMAEAVEVAGRFIFEYRGEAKDVISYFPLHCGDVEGDVSANSTVSCGDVAGDVSSGSTVQCGDVEGDVSANGAVACGDVEGDVFANGHCRL